MIEPVFAQIRNNPRAHRSRDEAQPLPVLTAPTTATQLCQVYRSGSFEPGLKPSIRLAGGSVKTARPDPPALRNTLA